MPSFDIVSRTDLQETDNAVNNARKEIEQQRFDFRGAKYTFELDKKEKKLVLTAEDGTKINAMKETFTKHAIRRKVSLKAFDFKESETVGGGMVKIEAKIRDGLEQDIAKDIVKRIKGAELKVQASIQGDEIRCTAKKIDDLQAVIAMLNADAEIKVPLQFVNMKRD
jgi:uncharacterized protein YajQ (UPF0234 family)